MSIEDNLHKTGIILPVPGKAVGSYVPVSIADNMAFVSGQIPVSDGQVVYAGKVPEVISLEEASQAARLCTINALSQLKQELGSLESIERIVRLEVFVNSSKGFTDQAKIANGASDLLLEIFGDSGKHARIAVGVSELPLNSAVEVAMIVQIKRY